MKIDIDALRDFHARDALVQGKWGDARETACLMSALTGKTSIEGCVAAGWPEWLAELGTTIFDNAPDDAERFRRGLAFAEALAEAEARGADLDDDGEVFRAIRLRAVLPIAMDAIGEGEEPWRVQCREVVQECIDSGGARARAVWAVRAAEAAWAAEAAEAARAARAAEAAEAVGAVGAARAAEAARAARAAEAARAARAVGAAEAAEAARAVAAAEAAWAAAHTRIFEATVAALRGEA